MRTFRDVLKEKMPDASKIILGVLVGAIASECAVFIAALVLATLLVMIVGINKVDFTARLRKIAIVLAIVIIARRNLP